MPADARRVAHDGRAAVPLVLKVRMRTMTAECDMASGISTTEVALPERSSIPAQLVIDVVGEAIRNPHMAGPNVGEFSGEAARCVNTKRPLTHHSPTRDGGLAMHATRDFDTLPAHVRRNIDRRPDGCWLWTRSKSRDGYGWASLGNKTYQAHRLVYTLIVGPIPRGLVLDHICRVRHCVNPDHLQPVTNLTNLLRSPIVPAGQSACLRCGSEFVVIGKTMRQRRCPKCWAAYLANRDHLNRLQRARRARTRASR